MKQAVRKPDATIGDTPASASAKPLFCDAPAIMPQPAATPKPPPSDAKCEQLWDRFAMPPHIRAHSMLVAIISTAMALRAREIGLCDCVQSVRASALLHDIAKHYTIMYGGNHAQLGGVWTLEATGNALIAQGVVHHVYWPWELDVERFFLPLCVIYADKRVQHDILVGVDQRFTDLMQRYATNDFIRGRIELSKQQAEALERIFNERLGIDLNACSFDSGRLVE